MLVNKKGLFLSLAICLIFLLFLLGVSYEDEVLEVEEKNNYSWQKYMNEDEYNQLEINMSYIDVVRIVGGAGEEVDADTYEWNDTYSDRLSRNQVVIYVSEDAQKQGTQDDGGSGITEELSVEQARDTVQY